MRSQRHIVLLVTAWCSEAFVLDPRRRTRPVACDSLTAPAVVPAASRSSSTARYNFLQDLLGSAFENDSSLSKVDKLDGMLDEGVVEDVDRDRNARLSQLTSTQQQWREKVELKMRGQAGCVHCIPIILPKHRGIVDQQIGRAAKMIADQLHQFFCLFGLG